MMPSVSESYKVGFKQYICEKKIDWITEVFGPIIENDVEIHSTGLKRFCACEGSAKEHKDALKGHVIQLQGFFIENAKDYLVTKIKGAAQSEMKIYEGLFSEKDDDEIDPAVNLIYIDAHESTKKAYTKTVTHIQGLTKHFSDITQIAKEIKKKVACSGRTRGKILELDGDQRFRVYTFLRAKFLEQDLHAQRDRTDRIIVFGDCWSILGMGKHSGIPKLVVVTNDVCEVPQ